MPISHVPSLSWQRERREWMPGVKIKGKHQIVGETLGQNREVYLGTWLVHFKSVSHTFMSRKTCQQRERREWMPGVKIKGKHQIVGETLGQNREVYLGTWLVHFKSVSHTFMSRKTCQQRERREWMPGVKIKGKHQIVGETLGQNREVYLGTWLVHFKSVSHTFMSRKTCQV